MDSENKKLKKWSGIAEKFNKNNTILSIKSLGEIELKYISFGDIIYLIDNLKTTLDAKEYTLKSLYHQLLKPEISYEEFCKIPQDKLTEITRCFVQHESHTFKYFSEFDNDIFLNFRNTINKYYQEEFKFHSMDETIQSSIKVINEFNRKYQGSIVKQIQESISIINEQYTRSQLQVTESLKPIIHLYQNSMVPVIQQIRNYQKDIAKHLEPCMTQIQFTANYLEKLKPQIELWQNWIKQNTNIYKKHIDYWREFAKQYKLTEKQALDILRKYKWPITPSLPFNFIFEIVAASKNSNSAKNAINRLFVEYFTMNNCSNLKDLFSNWKENEIFKPRITILKDCINLFSNDNIKINKSNLIIPTLIAQIDGIQKDFMLQKGVTFDSKKHKWKDNTGNVVKWNDWFQCQTLTEELLDVSNDIFLNILFQKALPGEPLKIPFTFNRHKIMHGEYLKYGRIDNSIRSFLILDFLASLK